MSNYPAAFDAFASPQPGSPRNNPSLSGSVRALGDAVEAIQAVLGLSPAGGSGTVSARIGVVEGGVLSRVSGPGSSTDNALVRFDGTDGKTVQNSGITVDDSGNFTTNLTVSKASPGMSIDAAAGGQTGIVYYKTAGVERWRIIKTGTAESGSNAGSNFALNSYSDAGAFLSTDVGVDRATGKATLGRVGATAGLELGASGPRVMSGTGSPEGVVTAPVGSTWTDTAATTGAIQWIKATGTGNTGWVVEYGDTGWRQLSGALEAGSSAGDWLMKRNRGTVTHRIYNATNSSGAMYLLPTGFRPAGGIGDGTAIAVAKADGTVGAVLINTPTSNGITLTTAFKGYTGAYLAVSYSTDNAWPASLPGTAA